MAESDEELFITQSRFISEEITESDILSEGGSDIEARFDRWLCESEIQDRVRQSVPLATRYKDGWAVRAFEAWRLSREKLALSNNTIRCFKTPLENMSADELNESISYFVFEVKKQDGTEYPANSVHSLVSSLQRHLKTQCGKNFRFFNDDVFMKLRTSVDAVMKERSSAGIGAQCKRAEVISLDEESQLWAKNILGEDNGRQLVETLVYLFGLHFALRGGKEHRRLRWVNPQIVLKYDDKGKKYLEYTEDISKTNAGGLNNRRTRGKTTRAHENADPSRCIVRLYEKYCSLCPKERTSDAFYLTPLRIPKNDCWYSTVALGHNKLASTVKRLCEAGGIQGFKTNHSLRATAATRLYDAKVDEQLICEKTGHRSLAVRAYKRTTKELEEGVSSVLYGNLTETKRICTTPSEAKKEVDLEPVEGKKKVTPAEIVQLKEATHEPVEGGNKKEACLEHDGGNEDKKKFNITINFNLNS